jgi:hypothetical protein
MAKIGPTGVNPPTVPSTPQDSSAKPAVASDQNQQTPTRAPSEPDRGKLSEHALEGQMMNVTLTAKAEREMAPIGLTQKVDITNPDLRNQLVRNAPQVNSISRKEGNENDICGAAATTNALILSSKTKDQAQANAKAVRDLANSYDPPIKIKPEEDIALKSLASGRMSPLDAEHMQQLMDRIGHRQPQMQPNPSGLGLSTAQVASMTTKLSAFGAFQGASVRMHCNTLPTGADHWTVTVDRTYANSAGGAKYDRSQVYGGPPPEVQKGNPRWQNEIILDNSEKPPKVYTQFKQPGEGNVYHEATFDTSRYKDPTSVGAFEKELLRAAGAPGTPIE